MNDMKSTPADAVVPATNTAQFTATTNIEPTSVTNPETGTQASPPTEASANRPSTPVDPKRNSLHEAVTAIQRLMLCRNLNRLERYKSFAMQPRTPSKPQLGEHDLLVEGSLKLTVKSGTFIHIPVHTQLTGSLSPAFIQLAQPQFEVVLDQLLVKPVTVAFIAHLQKLQTGAARGVRTTNPTLPSQPTKTF